MFHTENIYSTWFHFALYVHDWVVSKWITNQQNMAILGGSNVKLGHVSKQCIHWLLTENGLLQFKRAQPKYVIRNIVFSPMVNYWSIGIYQSWTYNVCVSLHCKTVCPSVAGMWFTCSSVVCGELVVMANELTIILSFPLALIYVHLREHLCCWS